MKFVSPYAELACVLLDIANTVRPDILFFVGKLARFSSAQKQIYWSVIKRLVRYFQQTKRKGISFEPGHESGIQCYSDSDFAGYNVNRKFTKSGAHMTFEGSIS